MSRSAMLTGSFYPHSHGQHGHYGVHAPNHYDGLIHPGLAFARPPLPMCVPVLPPAGFNHQHTGQHQHQHQHPHPHGRTSTFNMNESAYTPSDEEFAHLQKLSNEYQPDAIGPLVGERQSSAAITTEYANADPVFRTKTAALPAKYAYFRTCRGDGHCGWRAIAFTYFEALLRVGDANKLEDEEARLNSMGNLLDHIGYPRDIWIDFAEEAFELLRNLANSLHAMDGAAPDILLRSFNDMGVSMAIITYFKLLASAWVQSHADDFGHFVPMGDVKAYCANNIEPAQCEIDHIGVAALADALVKPAGFGLEVWYLDRSPGEEINRSYFSEPVDHNNMSIPGAPMLRLLYRPGHYDILYKAEDVPSPIQHQPIHPQPALQVNLANYSDDFVPAASNVPDVMTMIPGMFPTTFPQRWPSLSCEYSPSPVVQPQVTPCQSYPSAPASTTITGNSHFDFVSPVHSSHTDQYNIPSHHVPQLEQPPMTLPIHHPPQPSMSTKRAAPLAIERGGPFRPSMYELEPGFGFLGQTQPFQTSIFRNSHYNTAHFMNPEFQPEEWCPDGEYVTGNRGRQKSHSS